MTTTMIISMVTRRMTIIQKCNNYNKSIYQHTNNKRLLIKQLLQQRQGGGCYQLFSTLKTTASKNNTTDSDDNIDDEIGQSLHQQPHQQQEFSNLRFEGGEWDPDYTDPLYRPKYNPNSSRIISADDYANRCKVGFTGEFNTFSDAMVTLSWLDQDNMKQIYEMYISLINNTQSKYNTSSHEYTIQVVATKFNLTKERIAAIVQLKHNEEQIKCGNVEGIYDEELANIMDQRIKDEIDDAYNFYKYDTKKPDFYKEDPAGVTGIKESKKFTIAEDLLDIEDMTNKVNIRLDANAQYIFNNHIYLEDIYDHEQLVPIDKDCESLLKQYEKINNNESNENSIIEKQRNTKQAIEPQWKGTNGEGKKQRNRWKFIAQIVNTRELKQQKHKFGKKTNKGKYSNKNNKNNKKHFATSYDNNNPINTLVEENGNTLRQATVADIQTVAWKSIRNEHEFIYKNVKNGYLNYINNNNGDNNNAWGITTIPKNNDTDNDITISDTNTESTDNIITETIIAATTSDEDETTTKMDATTTTTAAAAAAAADTTTTVASSSSSSNTDDTSDEEMSTTTSDEKKM